MQEGAIFTFVVALAAGVACQLAARHTRIPSITLLLAAGVALGPDGLGLVHPGRLGDGLLALVGIAVPIILFEGGLNLDMQRLRREAVSVRRLLWLGALVTLLGGALAAHFLLGWPPALSALFGALVIVTGPTVVRPLLRNLPLRPRLATILEAEGLLIDPVGALVAAVVLQVALTPGVDTLAGGMLEFFAQLGFGAAVGLSGGFALGALLHRPRIVPEEFKHLVALAGALVVFALCETVFEESGILAVTIAGVVVGNMEKQLAAELGEFQEHLTVGLIGLLFVLLAADVRLADVARLGAPGFATVLALMFLVRPLGVALSTRASGMSPRERLFLAWVGPRGVVAAAIATLSAEALDARGVAGGTEIRALVFLTIALTVLLQGGGAPLLARRLRVRAPGRENTVILGAEELGFALAESLASVHFVDSNPHHCQAARERGFSALCGDISAGQTLQDLRLEQARCVIALTPNAQVNAHFAGEAKEHFDVPETWMAVEREQSAPGEQIARKQASRVLFDRAKDVAHWNALLARGEAALRRFEFAEAEAERRVFREPESDKEALQKTRDVFLLLALYRDGAWKPLGAEETLQAGDFVRAAVHLAQENEALAQLRAFGLFPAATETEASPGAEGAGSDAGGPFAPGASGAPG